MAPVFANTTNPWDRGKYQEANYFINIRLGRVIGHAAYRPKNGNLGVCVALSRFLWPILEPQCIPLLFVRALLTRRDTTCLIVSEKPATLSNPTLFTIRISSNSPVHVEALGWTNGLPSTRSSSNAPPFCFQSCNKEYGITCKTNHRKTSQVMFGAFPYEQPPKLWGSKSSKWLW